jgi:LPPG:FO 2-phospho-L-lactate transferase
MAVCPIASGGQACLVGHRAFWQRFSMNTAKSPRIVVLTGGVGGAKLVEGFAGVVPAHQLTVIANTGDDMERHGLWISPDVDIVTYTLAGRVDRKKGWGLRGDTFHTLDFLGRLGEEIWFNLGDRDLATHIFRTRLRQAGVRPSEIARRIATRLGVKIRIQLPTDDPIQTRVRTPAGECNFQEFFVRDRCRPRILGVRYAGAGRARPAPEALRALRRADLIVIAPSNPIASIGPILAVPGIRKALAATRAVRIAVSPIVGGRSLKGPSDRMLRVRGYAASPAGVARCYRGWLDGMVIDRTDAAHRPALERAGLSVLVADTVMNSQRRKTRLARQILGHRWRRDQAPSSTSRTLRARASPV